MKLELPYIAGFLDCDGTVTIVDSRRKNNRHEYYGKICFYSQNRPVLEEICEVIGGKITPLHRSSQVHVLQFAPKATVTALTVLLPYLRIKREQAAIVLTLATQKRNTQRVAKKSGKGGSCFLPEAVWEERRRLMLKIKKLNHEDAKQLRIDRSNRVNSAKPSSEEATPSRAAGGNGPAEGVTASSPSPNSNESHERPTLSIVSRREDIA